MNYNAEMPIYLQVIHDLKKKMIQGKILPGEKLHPTESWRSFIRSIRTLQQESTERWRLMDIVIQSGGLEHL